MKKCVLDSSFIIDLLNEIADAEPGPALRWVQRNPAAQLWITPVTLAEVLEGAQEPAAVEAYLARYSWQDIHRSHAHKVAARQRRAPHRMGENDAWQAAIAENLGAVLVGSDEAAFGRLGARYEDHRREPAQR